MGMTDDRLYECFRKVYDVFIDPPNLTENQEDNTKDMENRLGHLVNMTFSSEMITRYFIEQGWLPDITSKTVNKEDTIIHCKDCIHCVKTAEGEYNPDDIVCDYWMSDGLSETDYCSRGDECENK